MRAQRQPGRYPLIRLPSSTTRTLEDYDFKYTIHYSLAPAADNIPTGVVWSQSPKPQTTYTIGDPVTLWVQSQQQQAQS